MLIKYYTRDTTGEETFAVKEIPDKIQSIMLEFYPKPSSNHIGYMTFYWIFGDTVDCSSETISFTDDITYIEINGKDNFVIKNKNDLYTLYEYFTNTDVNKFIKKFKINERLQDAKSDFK